LKEKLHRFALENDCYGKMELLVESDARQGKKLILLCLPGVSPLTESFFAPLKFELREVSSFNRTDLGKLKK
jgi:hypothetical protein